VPGIPSVLVVHDAPSKYRLQDQPPLEWALDQMGLFSHYVFPSELIQKAWSAFEPAQSRPCVVIPNCCQEEEVEALRLLDRRVIRRRLGWPEDRFVVICLGSLQMLKGQDVLLGVLPHLVAAIPEIWIAFVGAPAGQPGARFVQGLQRSVDSSGLEKHVAFLGPRNDGLACLYAADALAVPSRSEVMPVAILEAMALGTPVVASNVGGIAELVEDGITGHLFPAEDGERLAAALLEVAADPQARRSLVEAARARYWSRFSRALFSRGYVAALGKLLAGEEWT
jgi:glycosyltransferase involved in cell wall biosynthesis